MVQWVILSTCNAKPKVLAKALPRLGGTLLRPKTLGRVVKVPCRTKEKDAKGPLISLENRNRKMPMVQWVILSTCNAKPKVLAKALPKLEETPNRPKILGREVKVPCRTKEKDAKGPLISLGNRNRKMPM